jgi:hypothetical protein
MGEVNASFTFTHLTAPLPHPRKIMSYVDPLIAAENEALAAQLSHSPIHLEALAGSAVNSIAVNEFASFVCLRNGQALMWGRRSTYETSKALESLQRNVTNHWTGSLDSGKITVGATVVESSFFATYYTPGARAVLMTRHGIELGGSAAIIYRLICIQLRFI